MEHCIAEAVRILREFPLSEDEELRRFMVSKGIDSPTAMRLIQFLPIAYSHLMLAGTGARLSNAYRRTLPNGALSEELLLESEPLWKEVTSFARGDVARGAAGAELVKVA